MNLLASLPNWFLRFLGANPSSDTSEVWFRFEGMDPGWALLLAGLFAALILSGYWKSFGKLSQTQRIGLAMLRSLFLLLVLIILTEPVIRVAGQKQTRGTLLVLLDVSASMELKDLRPSEIDQERLKAAYGKSSDAEANPRPSRRELVTAVAANQELKLWPRISEKVDVLVVPFGDKAGSPQPLGGRVPGEISLQEARSFFSALDYSAPATAISDSLANALEAVADRPLAGILLISDGANNAGAPLAAALEQLRRRNVPLFAYAAGVSAQRDLSVVSFTGPASVFVNETAVFHARLRATKLAGEASEVRLVQDGETIDSQQVSFDKDATVDIRFSYIPKKLGDYSFKLVAGEIEGELTQENNEATTELQVQDRRVRVLIIEQEPRWDFRYLMDTLKRDSRISVSAVMLDGDATLGRDPDSGFLAELPTPQQILDYVIVVLGDVDPQRLSPEHMDALDQLARQSGGGLIFQAGTNYNPHAFGGTPLELLLPVTIDPALNDTVSRVREPTPLALTFDGYRSPLLRLDPVSTENQRIWQNFPAVRWTAQTGPAKPGAKVLLVGPTVAKEVDGEPQPVMAHMPVGRGQVFYFGFDETWRWRSRVGEKHYLKVWGQVFLQLGAERLKGASDLVQLNTVRNSYAVGESILVYGRIFNENFQPLESTEVSGTLTIEPSADNAETIERKITLQSRPGQPGDYQFELLAETPGRYLVRSALDPEATVGFNVNASTVELRDPALNLEGLLQLAGSEDRVFREEELASLPDVVGELIPTIRVLNKYEPAFHPFVYTLLLLLAITEWASRRMLKLK